MPVDPKPPEGTSLPTPKAKARRFGFLPSRKTASTGRVVVTLSSVAKLPPPVSLTGSTAAPVPPTAEVGAPASVANDVVVTPAPGAAHRQVPPNRTTEVKLPPKTGVLPKLTSLNRPATEAVPAKTEASSPAKSTPPPEASPAKIETSKADAAKPVPSTEVPKSSAEVPTPAATPPPAKAATPPPLPMATPADKNAARTTAFRLKPLQMATADESESIFAETPAAARPAGWKHLQPGELPPADDAPKEGLVRAPGLRADAGPKVIEGLLAPPLPVGTDSSRDTAPPLLAPSAKDHPEKLHLPPPLKAGHARPIQDEKEAAPAPVPPPISAKQATTEVPPAETKPDAVATNSQEELPLTKEAFLAGAAATAAAASTVEPIPGKAEKLAARTGIFTRSGKREKGTPTVSPEKNPPPSVPASASAAATPPGSDPKSTLARSARLKRRRLVSTVAFYLIFLGLVVPSLFLLGVHFSSETRIEGQVIPPPGMMLSNEVWIVSDFRDLANGIADDLAAERAPKIQEIQERQDHVQRAQADIAAREERIRLLTEQVQAGKDEIASVIKQAHDAAQQVWDGPGAALENEYNARLDSLRSAIAARAKSLNLSYVPDPTYQSPEVWANAYRLALYQTPAGVDGAKEHQWIEDQLKLWRDFTKTFDDSKEKLRAQAAQIQLAPTSQVTDLNAKIDDLQHRIEATQAEEVPLKAELAQAQTDLAQAQAAEAGLDVKYYQELYQLPGQSITKRLPLAANGRFTWSHLEKDSAFSQGERSHSYWIFSRAIRKDGRQFWVLSHFSIAQNSLLPMLIEPASFVSTRAILRPDLSADDAP